MEELIIEASLNEQVTKAENPRVPIAVDEIVADGLAAARAGASILHFHARDERTGALLHPGAVNYADYDPHAKKIGWDYVLSVTHAEVAYFLALAKRIGIQWSYTVREPGQIRHVLAYRDMGLAPDPLFFKITMSEKHLWGVPPSIAGLKLMTEGVIPAGTPYRWMLFVEGGSASFVQLCRHAVENGGHVRVGVGDTPLYAGRTLSNAEQVAEIVAMAKAAGRGVATPERTRAMLRRNPGARASQGR